MMTIQEYADRAGVSRQAISRQINSHLNDLTNHITTQGRTQYLDDDAVAYLDELRGGDPVVVQCAEQRDELQELRDERDALKNQLILLQQQMIQQLQDDSEQIRLLTDTRSEREQKLQNRCETLEQQLDEAHRREESLNEQIRDLNDHIWQQDAQRRADTIWNRIAFWRR